MSKPTLIDLLFGAKMTEETLMDLFFVELEKMDEPTMMDTLFNAITSVEPNKQGETIAAMFERAAPKSKVKRALSSTGFRFRLLAKAFQDSGITAQRRAILDSLNANRRTRRVALDSKTGPASRSATNVRAHSRSVK
jgi:hypothetical protein